MMIMLYSPIQQGSSSAEYGESDTYETKAEIILGSSQGIGLVMGVATFSEYNCTKSDRYFLGGYICVIENLVAEKATYVVL